MADKSQRTGQPGAAADEPRAKRSGKVEEAISRGSRLSGNFIGFISLFALDVFGEQQGLWNTLVGLAIHLIPSLVLVILVVAWRREWVGAALYAGAGALYVLTIVPRPSPPAVMKLIWCATIAGPAL